MFFCILVPMVFIYSVIQFRLNVPVSLIFFYYFFSIPPPPGLLLVLGPLTRYMTPTLDAALLMCVISMKYAAFQLTHPYNTRLWT